MTSIPDCVWVRGYVLNHLEAGPVRVADLIQTGAVEFGFTEWEIKAAGEHFAVTARVINGELYWLRPENLFAIWWSNASKRDYERRSKYLTCQGAQASRI